MGKAGAGETDRQVVNQPSPKKDSPLSSLSDRGQVPPSLISSIPDCHSDRRDGPGAHASPCFPGSQDTAPDVSLEPQRLCGWRRGGDASLRAQLVSGKEVHRAGAARVGVDEGSPDFL